MDNSFQDFVRTPVKFITDTETDQIKCFGTAAKLLIPNDFVTATLSFAELLPDGSFSNAIKDFDGTAISIASVAAGDSIPLDPSIFGSIQYFKIVSSVTQTGEKPIFVIFTPVFGINA